MTEQQFADSKDHKVAMAVHAMMSAITDLCHMANDGLTYSDIDDVKLSYSRLGYLLALMERKDAA